MDEAKEKRLQSFERMRLAIIDDQKRTIKELNRLKRLRKMRTVTYRQLSAQKLANKNMLDLYKIYDIEDEEGEIDENSSS